MRKILFSISLWALAVVANAQLRYDANWIFGYNAGIKFENDTIINFHPVVFNQENSACISDSLGNLLFYLSDTRTQILGSDILDKNGNIINNIDSPLFTNLSCTNGALILPVLDNEYFIFHLSLIEKPLNVFEQHLFYTIAKVSNEEILIKEKNIPLYIQSQLGEKITAVKHANGKDWWIIVSEENTNCTNKFIKFLLSDKSVSIYNYQNLGVLRCSGYNPGEMKISKSGNKICNCVSTSQIPGSFANYIEILSINRCNGELISQYGNFIDNLYSCEFSENENHVYFTNTSPDMSRFFENKLSQLNMQNNTISTIYTEFSKDTTFGQLEITPDNKIVLTMTPPQLGNQINLNYNKINKLSVIEFPDSTGSLSNFKPYYIELNDSSRTSYGLPNFPNYNLGPLSIYEADAGRDTVICTDSTNNQKVVPLGSLKVAGVQYQWYPNYNLSSDTTAQPLAFPDSSTWYYVMLSDTSIKNACKTRLDSVLVEVKNCVTSVKNLSLKPVKYEIIPNPSSVEKGGNIIINEKGNGEVLLYSIEGKQIGKVAIQTGENTINFEQLGIKSGVLIYKVMWNNKLNNTARLVILN